jgi:uncharacterized protein YwbE
LNKVPGIDIEWSFLCNFTGSVVCDFLGECLKHEAILRNHDASIELNQKLITKSKKGIGRLEAKLSSFENRLSDIAEGLKVSFDRIDELEKSVSRHIDERIAEIERHFGVMFGGLEVRWGAVEKSTKHPEVRIGQLTGTMESQRGRIEKMTSDLRRDFETFRKSEFAPHFSKVKLAEGEITRMKKPVDSRPRTTLNYEPGRELTGIS